MLDHFGQQGLSLFAGPRTAEEAHHLPVGVKLGKRIEVVRLQHAQAQPGSFEALYTHRDNGLHICGSKFSTCWGC